MSRELKFRAWDSAQKKFINPSHYYLKTDGTFNVNFKKITLQQYTGLKDKNGIEIYEGDIYKNYWNLNDVVTYEICKKDDCIGHNAFIKVVEAGYFLEQGIEIIGNIYENPELVEKEK